MDESGTTSIPSSSSRMFRAFRPRRSVWSRFVLKWTSLIAAVPSAWFAGSGGECDGRRPGGGARLRPMPGRVRLRGQLLEKDPGVVDVPDVEARLRHPRGDLDRVGGGGKHR